tara:strand:+ start:234 stop:470 length:237 start_codon:yes stop_codon:yes gene_type:complete
MAAASTPQLIVNALVSRCRAQRDEALAELSVLINTSVGVGEHPSHVADAAALLQKLAEAEEQLESLERNFVPQAQPEQ